jgi:CTP-dependent riboflavin kinase
MSQSDKINEALEEHAEHLRLESEQISILTKRVQHLERIVTNLAKTVEIYGSVLPNIKSGHPYWAHEHWKQSLAKYAQLNEELVILVKSLSQAD